VLYAKYTPNVKEDSVHRLAVLIAISYALVIKMGYRLSGACFNPAISASLFALEEQDEVLTSKLQERTPL